ncbi:MAG: hypothetical protein PF689_00865, partial [Deltaproteobacteria bacterium]|nr:hypothetical protein [Deltaproteobacteria bacterium]
IKFKKKSTKFIQSFLLVRPTTRLSHPAFQPNRVARTAAKNPQPGCSPHRQKPQPGCLHWPPKPPNRVARTAAKNLFLDTIY